MASEEPPIEEPLTLSADTLDALKTFYNERDTREREFADLKAQVEDGEIEPSISMDSFAEDWNASQFWYDEQTASTLAQQLLESSTSDSCIAIVSAPSVFVKLKQILSSNTQRPTVRLLEFDRRFEIFPEFVPYDFAHSTRLPLDLKGKFDRIICDPPFLSTDCQLKVAVTARWLSKPSPQNSWASRLILCTGERMGSSIMQWYAQAGLKLTDFEPQHAKGLSNEFRCFANFESEAWKFSNS